MLSKRRPVGDSLDEVTIKFVGAAPRERGRDARVFWLLRKLSGLLKHPKSTARNGCATDGATKPSSAADEVAEEIIDAGFFAGVILLGNGAGLFAQLERKPFFLQRGEIVVYGFLDDFDAGLLPRGFVCFFRFRRSRVLAVCCGRHDNLFVWKQNRTE